MIGEWPEDLIAVSKIAQVRLAQIFESQGYTKEAALLDKIEWDPVAPGKLMLPKRFSPEPEKEGIFVWRDGVWVERGWCSFKHEDTYRVLFDLNKGLEYGLYALAYCTSGFVADEHDLDNREMVVRGKAYAALVQGANLDIWPVSMKKAVEFSKRLFDKVVPENESLQAANS